MAGRLEGKVAVVTGAGRGIGRGEALLLAQEGAAVVVNDIGGATDGTGQSSSPADEVVAEIRAAGGRAVANYDTVATMEGGQRIVQTALGSFGRLDIVVNNAGILRDRMFHNMTEEDWDAVVAVHLKGHFAVSRAAAVIFREQRSGRIVNTSSLSGLGWMGQANYSTVKEGIVGFTRTVARDLGGYGVTVNAIRPGAGTRLTLTDNLRASAGKAAKVGQTELADGLKNLEEWKPEYVAPLVVWLCTDQAAHVNGRIFLVMGPTVALYPEPEPIRTLYNQHGYWTVDELLGAMPGITKDLVNPAPPRP
ncbi:MAG: SDR family NAD(P)-dependent oxidoreductase [Chloroflexota bacterium]|nr:MAG: SDR family NAD(P)-dependent oxidoreductase [Chloroflexota bacterium]